MRGRLVITVHGKMYTMAAMGLRGAAPAIKLVSEPIRPLWGSEDWEGG